MRTDKEECMIFNKVTINTNDLHMIIWFHVFLSNTNNFQIYLTHRQDHNKYYYSQSELAKE